MKKMKKFNEFVKESTGPTTGWAGEEKITGTGWGGEERIPEIDDTEIDEEVTEKKKWSGDVKVEKEEKPKEGTFSGKAEDIVKELLKKAEGNKGTAMKKLQFYINRAGKNLSNKAEIEKAKSILKKK